MTTLLLTLSVLGALILGSAFGVALAKTDSIPQSSQIEQPKVSLPSEILDRNGKVIAQFSGAERHDQISLTMLPKYVVYALLTREDQNFYHEGAFSLRGTMRAAINIAIGNYFSGGSTITQQLAGMLYTNRDKKTIVRKLKELWYAFQLEKRLTKSQILELYLNNVYFGRNNYGIEAASQYYFGHSASRLTLAESAMLIIQLADPARYYWLKYPDRARVIQHVVLQEMVKNGYVTQAEADQSFAQFWATYPYSRAASTASDLGAGSKAPYFSEYVRQQLEQDLFGKLDYLRDGLVVHTTLNLDYQHYADQVMHSAISKYNSDYKSSSHGVSGDVSKSLEPLLSLLSYSFNLPQINRVGSSQNKQRAMNDYLLHLNPAINVVSMMLGLDHVAQFTAMAHVVRRQKEQSTQVEGALITLDDHTGEILAMVGGYDWNTSKFNRAVDGRIQEGSSIKPLYYSVAISSGKLTAASRLYDGPVIFYNQNGTPYQPYDFLGQWQGAVSVRWALQDSINVPSLEVLQTVGFDAAINRISRMLGMEQYKNDPNYFPRVYPLGLGIIPVAPINMARAYAVFANQGREVDPIAINYVEDRATHQIILEPERQLRDEQKRRGNALQIMSPQAAYVMVNLLESVVSGGTLWQTPYDVGGFDGMPMAGKTGTTQNWSDAWTVGFSPYYTTAVWFGFDQKGRSLGLGLTGATAAGPAWARYMKDIHRGLPRIDFTKPASGLVTERVDASSGLLPTKYSTKTKDEIFIAGTEPRQFDTLSEFQDQRNSAIMNKLQNSAIVQGLSGTPGDAGTGTSPSPLGDLSGGTSGAGASSSGGSSGGTTPGTSGAGGTTPNTTVAGGGLSGSGSSTDQGINPLLN